LLSKTSGKQPENDFIHATRELLRTEKLLGFSKALLQWFATFLVQSDGSFSCQYKARESSPPDFARRKRLQLVSPWSVSAALQFEGFDWITESQ